jgi:hypothetical protein
MTEQSLKRRMQLKKIGLQSRHRTEHKIKALRAADARDMAKYQAWEGRRRGS